MDVLIEVSETPRTRGLKCHSGPSVPIFMIILLVHRDHPSIRFHRPLHHDSRTYCQRIDTTPARTDWITGDPPGSKVYNSAETNRPISTSYFKHRTMHCNIRVHDRQGMHREPVAVQLVQHSGITTNNTSLYQFDNLLR